MKLTLRIRDEPNNLATVWLIAADGDATSGLLYGVMRQDDAIRLGEAMGEKGVKIERTVNRMERHDEPRPETVMQKQGALFAGENEP